MRDNYLPLIEGPPYWCEVKVGGVTYGKGKGTVGRRVRGEGVRV